MDTTQAPDDDKLDLFVRESDLPVLMVVFKDADGNVKVASSTLPADGFPDNIDERYRIQALKEIIQITLDGGVEEHARKQFERSKAKALESGDPELIACFDREWVEVKHHVLSP